MCLLKCGTYPVRIFNGMIIYAIGVLLIAFGMSLYEVCLMCAANDMPVFVLLCAFVRDWYVSVCDWHASVRFWYVFVPRI